MCYIYPPVFNLAQNPQQAVVRLLQGLKTVLAWQTSSRHIHKKATYFGQRVDGKQVKFCLSRFCYHKDVLQSTAFDVDAVLPLLREWQAPLDNPYTRQQAESIIHRTLNAKVHAEAALMDWITTKEVGLPIFHVKFNYHQTHISRSRAIIHIRIGPLALARNAANYVGHSIISTSQKDSNSYYQVLMVPSILGFLPLGSLTVFCLNSEMSCLLHARHWLQVIPDTALLAPPQVMWILLCSHWEKVSTIYDECAENRLLGLGHA